MMTAPNSLWPTPRRARRNLLRCFRRLGSWRHFRLCPAKCFSARPSLVYCGDDESGKGVAAGLIRDVGFDPVDAGPLRIARYTEPFALLVAQLAYEGTGG